MDVRTLRTTSIMVIAGFVLKSHFLLWLSFFGTYTLKKSAHLPVAGVVVMTDIESHLAFTRVHHTCSVIFRTKSLRNMPCVMSYVYFLLALCKTTDPKISTDPGPSCTVGSISW